MFQEAAQAPHVVDAQLAQNAPLLRELGARLRAEPPRAVVTCARGSSDHAATYARYLIEAHTHVLTSSAAPSVSSIYDAQSDLDGVLFIAISQSGKSPDLLAATRNARRTAARSPSRCAIRRTRRSCSCVDVAVPLHAGPETSVAATKSYIASLSCIAQLLANWTEDRRVVGGAAAAPRNCWRAPGNATGPRPSQTLRGAVNLFVVARGFGLGVAQEAALKLKETCGLHAEAFSSAEVKHGPMALVRAGFPGAHVHAARRHARRHRRARRRVRRARRARAARRRRGRAARSSLPTVVAHPVIEPMLHDPEFLPHGQRHWRWRAASIPTGRRISTK